MTLSSAAPRIGRSVIVALVLCGLVAFALWLRFVYSGPGIRLGDRFVHDIDPDPYYHLRRLEYAFLNGGALLRADAYANAPGQFYCPWPVAFDYLALGTNILLGDGTQSGLLLVAGIFPMFLGALTIVVALFLLRRETSIFSALVAVTFIVASREAISVSAFGLFDHHVLELLWWIVIALCAHSAVRSRARQSLLLGAVALGVGIFLVDATYFAVLIVGAAGCGLLLYLRRTRLVASELAEQCRAFGLFLIGGGAGMLAASSLELLLDLPRALPHTGRAGLACGLAGVGFALDRKRSLLIPGLACATGLALALPTILRGAGFVTSQGDPISPIIMQSKSMWAVNWPTLQSCIAFTALAAAMGLDRRKNVHELAMSTLAVGGGLLSLVQVKYWFLSAWTGAFAIAYATHWMLGKMAARKQLLHALIALLAVWYLFARGQTEFGEARPRTPPQDVAFALLTDAIRARTPLQDSLSPQGKPDWSIALRPDQGPRTLQLTGRAVTAIPFWGTRSQLWQYQQTLKALLERDETRAVALLESLKARYLLIEDLSGFAMGFVRAAQISNYEANASSRMQAYKEALWYRLFRFDGGENSEFKALRHFRLVAATVGAGTVYKFFERVAGATLGIHARPNEVLRFIAEVQSLDGGVFPYSASAKADSSGRLQLTVPYATAPSTNTAYALRASVVCGAQVVPISISDTAVTAGEKIEVRCDTGNPAPDKF